MNGFDSFALPVPEISDEDFEYFSSMIFQEAGIFLTDKKKDLLRFRLRNHIHSLGMSDYSSYRTYLEKIPDRKAQQWQEFVNLLTTNKTDFFREPKHFEFLQDEFLPSWKIKSGSTKLSVWSCASSSGQEPYTLAMVLDERIAGEYQILATDIDTEILSEAKNGVYPLSLRGQIPDSYADRYTIRGKDEVSGWFKIVDSLRDRVSFAQHNLTNSALPAPADFDIIFCRNVLIYFSPDTVAHVVAKLHKALKPEGLLFIGHSESIGRSSKLFDTLTPSILRKRH